MRHLCQGPRCHTYDTLSRVRGIKGNKVLRTRFARFNNNVIREWVDNWEHYFCDDRCLHDWLKDNIVNLMQFVGMKTIPQETPVDVIVEDVHRWGRQWRSTNIIPKNNLVVSQ
jgi:hypothetical protein